MKTFKVIGAAFVLAFALSMPTYADNTAPGDVHTPGRSTTVPCDPTTEPEDTGLTGGAPAIDKDISSLSISDILWALASIY